MAELDWERFAQPYIGTVDDLRELLFPSRTTAQLADVDDSINTANKFLGKRVYESTLQFDYIADGPAAADTWTLSDGLGGTQVTPS